MEDAFVHLRDTNVFNILRRALFEWGDYHNYQMANMRIVGAGLVNELSFMFNLRHLADLRTRRERNVSPQWILELLYSIDDNYALSLQSFEKDPESTVVTIEQEVYDYVGSFVARGWMKGNPLKGFSDLTAGSLSTSLQAFFEIVEETQKSADWNRITMRVNKFCSLAGVQSPTDNPFTSLEALRETIPTQTGRETELLAEIESLKQKLEMKEEELGRQRRIIEDISYRHLMENIIDPAEWTGNYASNWHAFWNDAVTKATRTGNQPAKKPKSPVVALIQKFGGQSTGAIKGTGGAMYGALSTNIHHYGDSIGGVYKLQSQRDKMPEEIMMALQPDKANIQNGKVDWAAERRRFI